MRTPLGQRERVVSDNGNVWWRYHNAAKCKDCGCTNANECRNAHGNGIPCFWVSSEEDWCSRCAGVTLHLPTDLPVSSPETSQPLSDGRSNPPEPSFAGPQGDRLGGAE